jgi:hypothetical protein
MEVAVAAMPPGVDQCVLILDAGGKLLVSCYTLQKSQAEIWDSRWSSKMTLLVYRETTSCKIKLEFDLHNGVGY